MQSKNRRRFFALSECFNSLGLRTKAPSSVGTESDGRSSIISFTETSSPSTKGTTESQPCHCQGVPPLQEYIELFRQQTEEYKETKPGVALPEPFPCCRDLEERGLRGEEEEEEEEEEEKEEEQGPLNFDDTLEQAESSFREATAKNDYWTWSETQQNWYHGPTPERAEIWYPPEWLPSASHTSPEAGKKIPHEDIGR